MHARAAGVLESGVSCLVSSAFIEGCGGDVLCRQGTNPPHFLYRILMKMGMIKEFLKEKKNRWRAALFLAFAVLAVAAITYGITSYAQKEPGYYQAEPDAQTKTVAYDSGVVYYGYAGGSSDEVKHYLNGMNAAYSASLLRAYKELDAENTYDGFTNIATLNQHIGEELQISGELMNVLRDALAKTRDGKGYNVFSGALHAQWRTLLYLDSPDEFDPAADVFEAQRMADIAAMTADLSHFNLEIVDAEKHIVRLTVDEAYQTFAQNMEISAPALDLNVLRKAYLLQWVAADMAAQGYADGYLATDDGLSMVLNAGDMQHSLAGLSKGKAMVAATMPAEKNSVCCQMTAYPLTDRRYGYYTFMQDGATYMRHPWVNAQTGESGQLLLSAGLLARDMKPVDGLYCLITMTGAATEAEAQRMLRAACPAGGTAFYTAPEAPDTLFVCGETAGLRLAEGVEAHKF